ncbi:HNH endonuclease signature motif containing protein [Nocardia cyriacigeorgica]|nr:HNH endonuclease signature motif containing protein [Nocardia cyriacigeorgica]
MSGPADPVMNLRVPSVEPVEGARPAAHATVVDPAVLAEAAARDHRSPAQRNHDALKALLASGVISEQLGNHRGVPVATILTMSVNDVEREAGVATTATGGTVPLRDALEMAQRSQPWLAVFDHAGLPLHLGRMKRLASRDQRLALIATLKGCSRPGCNAPASLCAVHHVLDYRKNGATDIENLTLACDACHALIHDKPGGWKTRIEGPHSPYADRTAWIAPPHIDPQQKPRLNHRHHTPANYSLERSHASTYATNTTANNTGYGEANREHPHRTPRDPSTRRVHRHRSARGQLGATGARHVAAGTPTPYCCHALPIDAARERCPAPGSRHRAARRSRVSGPWHRHGPTRPWAPPHHLLTGRAGAVRLPNSGCPGDDGAL